MYCVLWNQYTEQLLFDKLFNWRDISRVLYLKVMELPSSVFGTDAETHVGLLNKAVPVRGTYNKSVPSILIV